MPTLTTHPRPKGSGSSKSPIGALGDPTRRAIFEQLADGPRPVVELAELFPISRPAVSQHLAVLQQAGLVSSLAAGRMRIYRIEPRGVEAIHAYLDRFWDRSLAAFKLVAEQQRGSL